MKRPHPVQCREIKADGPVFVIVALILVALVLL